MIGQIVAEVIESKDENFPKGCIVLSKAGWMKTGKVRLENCWNSKQMITEGDAAIPLDTTLHTFRNQEKTKQRSTIVYCTTSYSN